MADWKTSTVILIMTVLIFFNILKNNNQNQLFEIDSDTLRYHANWTSTIEKLPHQKQLKQALRLNKFRNLDLSFAHSTIKPEFLNLLFTQPFSINIQSAKINLASVPLHTNNIEYMLSLLPNSLKKLQIHLDSIQIESQFGISLAYQLNRFTLLESLKISLVLSLTKNPDQFGIFLKLHKPREQLKSLNFILIGNELKAEHLKRLPQYLNKFNLKQLQLNLYANKISAEGSQILAKALTSQHNLQRLNLDLYFNNVTEIGTKSICQQIKKLQTLQALGLNFDFNFIKNEGGKQIGNLLKQMKNLKQLQIGVAQKNFGYLGFKSIIDGMKTLQNLNKLTLRCGINRVGINGAQIVKQMLDKMINLTYINLGFVQNYIGDQGIKILSNSVSKLPNLQQVFLNLGFNDAKSYGLIQSLKYFAENKYNRLYLGFSNNQFRDHDVQLIKKYLPKLIKNNDKFDFDFMDTAISKKMMGQIKQIFKQNCQNCGKKYQSQSQLFINSIIPEIQNKNTNDVQTQKIKAQQQRIKAKLDFTASEKLKEEQKKQAMLKENQLKQKAQKQLRQKKQRQQKQFQQNERKKMKQAEQKIKKEQQRKLKQAQQKAQKQLKQRQQQRKLKQAQQKAQKQLKERQQQRKLKQAQQKAQKQLKEKQKVKKQGRQKKKKQQNENKIRQAQKQKLSKQKLQQEQENKQKQRMQIKQKKEKQEEKKQKLSNNIVNQDNFIDPVPIVKQQNQDSGLIFLDDEIKQRQLKQKQQQKNQQQL